VGGEEMRGATFIVYVKSRRDVMEEGYGGSNGQEMPMAVRGS
jgi:hypothetical protein